MRCDLAWVNWAVVLAVELYMYIYMHVHLDSNIQ